MVIASVPFLYLLTCRETTAENRPKNVRWINDNQLKLFVVWKFLYEVPSRLFSQSLQLQCRVVQCHIPYSDRASTGQGTISRKSFHTAPGTGHMETFIRSCFIAKTSITVNLSFCSKSPVPDPGQILCNPLGKPCCGAKLHTH